MAIRFDRHGFLIAKVPMSGKRLVCRWVVSLECAQLSAMNQDGNASNSLARHVRGMRGHQKMMSKQLVFICNQNESDRWP